MNFEVKFLFISILSFPPAKPQPGIQFYHIEVAIEIYHNSADIHAKPHFINCKTNRHAVSPRFNTVLSKLKDIDKIIANKWHHFSEKYFYIDCKLLNFFWFIVIIISSVRINNGITLNLL